jgi:hypothetical protein
MGVLGNQSLPFDPTRTSGRPRDAQRFSGDGVTTVFQLDVSVSNPTDVEVFVENIQQEPTVAYDLFGRTLTFSEAPDAGTNNIYVIYRNVEPGVYASIPDGSITFSKLANNIRLFTTDNFTGDGGTTTFNLSSDVADANTLMVAVDGVFQRAPIHYTASNSTITFSSAPPATSNVHVRHLGFRTTQTVTALPANTTISQPTLESPVVGGNMTFNGTGNRIRGDFSNATIANRVMFQTSTVNTGTSIAAIANGVPGTNQTNFAAFQSSDPNNTSAMVLGINNLQVDLSSTRIGTGDFLPLRFSTGGSERMRIDTDGRVGIGKSNPGKVLDVNGEIRKTTIFKTQGAGGSNPGEAINQSINGMWAAAAARGAWAKGVPWVGNNLHYTLFKTGTNNSFMEWEVLLYDVSTLDIVCLYANSADGVSRTGLGEYSVNNGASWISLNSGSFGSGSRDVGGSINIPGTGNLNSVRFRTAFQSGATSNDLIGIYELKFTAIGGGMHFIRSLG